jgi:tetratricopeptide repeat protein 21B
MSKAEEYMGMIKEKERIYIDAAGHYEKAWSMSNKRNAGVGFRLAFNYMKACRFVDAIDVGKEILKVYPDYPKVQKDIVEKAR